MKNRESTQSEEELLARKIKVFLSLPDNERFIHHLSKVALSGDEDQVIELLKMYSSQHGTRALKDLCELKAWGVHWTLANRKIVATVGSMLLLAASCEYNKLADYLIDLGVDINSHAINSNNHQQCITPLAASIINNNNTQIQRLLKSGASLQKSVEAAASVNSISFFESVLKLPNLADHINISSLYEIIQKIRDDEKANTKWKWTVILIDLNELIEKQLSSKFESLAFSMLSSPEKSIEFINNFIRKHGKIAFLKLANKAILITGSVNELTLYGTILMQSFAMKNLQLSKYLLELGVDINAGTRCEDREHDNLSPLLLSCARNDVDAIKFLLDNNAKIERISSTNANALMYIRTNEAFDLIIDAVKKSGKLQRFLTIKDTEDNFNVYNKCLTNNRPTILLRLLNLEFDFPEKNKIFNKLFEQITREILSDPRNSKNKWMNVYNTLREMIIKQKIKPIRQEHGLSFSKNTSSDKYSSDYKDVAACYQSLFHEQLNSDTPKSREDAIKFANAQFYALLTNPERCVPYLRFLNDELERYYQETYPTESLPNVDNEYYKFRTIDNAEYPIPLKGSPYFNVSTRSNVCAKHSALKNMLIALFRHHGIGQRAVKWIGFVSNEIADEMVSEGDFIIESGAAGVTILHGSLSHMLQTAILLYAIDHGDISLQYNVDGDTKYLTAKEIIASLVNVCDSDGDHLWMTIRDQRYNDKIAFSDPHRLSSVIMKDGTRLGMKTLSNFLIDSFCKSLVKYHEIVRINIPFLNEFDNFLDIISTLPSAGILNVSYMIDHIISKYSQMNQKSRGDLTSKKYEIKTGMVSNSRNQKFATAAANHYHPSPLFVPRSFTDTVSELYEVTDNVILSDTEAAYVTSPDPLLGCDLKASRMYYDATSSLWKLNLPPDLKDRRFTFFTESRDPKVMYTDRVNDTVSISVPSMK